MDRKKEQWITGPKVRQKGGGGWRETEELLKRQKINPFGNEPAGEKEVKKDIKTLPNSNVQSAVIGIKQPTLPAKPAGKYEIEKSNKITPPSVTDEKNTYKKSPLMLPAMKGVSISKSLDLDMAIDDIPEDYQEKVMFEKLKSRVPSEELPVTFEYYERLEGEEEEEEKETVMVQDTSASKVREYLEKMLTYSPSPALTELMFRELEPLGEVLIGECQKFGIGIIIFERYRNLTEIKVNDQLAFPPGTKVRDGRGWEIVRGAYNPQHRMMFMAEELISGIPGGVSTHEFGHAYDHAWMELNDMKFGFSVFLWNKFYDEGMFISEYASTQPKEYFAESLQAYFNPMKKDILKRCDPKMYGFIGNLIAGVHKKPKKGLSD